MYITIPIKELEKLKLDIEKLDTASMFIEVLKFNISKKLVEIQDISNKNKKEKNKVVVGYHDEKKGIVIINPDIAIKSVAVTLDLLEGLKET